MLVHCEINLKKRMLVHFQRNLPIEIVTLSNKFEKENVSTRNLPIEMLVHCQRNLQNENVSTLSNKFAHWEC